jgi:AraC-like DNA-binding protein
MLIQKSSGTQYVGDNVSPFAEGDIVFLGPNIPHIFRNPPEYFDPKSKKKAKATVLYFSEKIVESDFFNLTEMQSIKKLLAQSKNGIKINNDSKAKVAAKFLKCVKSSNEERIINFLALLHFIATEAKYRTLSSNGFINNTDDKDLNRLNDVFEHLLNNFHDSIHLNTIAEIANMSPTAFCRFFKKHTNKTMVTFLNEIRIGHACKLLIKDESLNISQICFECGYNNLTNFIIQFKKLKGVSPLNYRRKYHQQKVAG